MSFLISNFKFSQPTVLVDGTPVAAANLQPIISTLYDNDQYLKSILDYFVAPSALVKQVEVDINVEVGHPVYYDPVDKVYKLANYAASTINNQLLLEESAEVWGIVIRKTEIDSALILIDGIAQIDLTNSTNSATPSGKFYLSDTPGQLVSTPPNDLAPVFVLAAAGDGNVLFRPFSADFSGLILQWRHDLVCEAAGTVVVNGNRLEFATTNTNVAGWLPVNSSAFSGMTPPASAVFGYNIAADQTLSDRWPPKYLPTIYLEFDRGLDPNVGGTGVPLGGGGLAVVNNDTIWWLSDCIDDCPFDLTPQATPVPGNCPRDLVKRLKLYAARPSGRTISSLSRVASLRSLHPGLRVFERDTTTTADSGFLDLQLQLINFLSVDNDESSLALKSVQANKFTRGPIVTSLEVDGPGLVLTEGDDLDSAKYGKVKISLTGTGQREITPQIVSLRRAEERSFNGTVAIGLPTQRDSGIRSQFNIPLSVAPDTDLVYRVWVMGVFESGGPTAPSENLSLTYKIVSAPDPTTVVGSGADVASSFTSAVTINQGTVYEIVSAPIQVQPGDIVYLDIGRTPGAATYQIHVLKHFLYIAP
jgi:hypothetical protein